MNQYYTTKFQTNQVVGIDEVGRGAWAGPLVAAAVILKGPIDGLNDSKLLSRAKREALAEVIYRDALGVGLGWVEPNKIDEFGLTAAIAQAMLSALKQIQTKYDQIIIDGAFNFLPAQPNVFCLPKADQTVPAVSAASIIAKVARDEYMRRASVKFPRYGFDSHVGYGTRAHIDSIKENGVCELHRLSYKPLLSYA